MDFFRPSNWKMWIVFCLVFKLVQGYFLLSGMRTSRGQFYVMQGDSPYYYSLANSVLIEKGYWLLRSGIYPDAIRDIEWDKDPEAAHQRDFAFRMPGYALLLAPALWLFGLDGGLNSIVLLQLIFSAISAYLLAHLIYLLTKSKAAFWAFLAIYLLSAYVSKFAFVIMSESMSISLLIIVLYCSYRVAQREWESPLVFLVMGVGMTAAIFMRPFFIPFFALIAFYLIWHVIWKPNALVALSLFLMPFIIAESVWITRNYYNTGKYIPLETSSDYSKTINKTFQAWNSFVVTWGENWLFWEKGSLSAWLLPDDFFRHGNIPVSDNVLPEWIRNDPQLLSEVKSIKADYETCLDRSVPLEERLKIQAKNIEQINNLTDEIQKRFPFRYYIGGRLNIFHEFISERVDMSYRTIKLPVNVLYSFLGPAINYFVSYFCFALVLILLSVHFNNWEKLPFVLLVILFIPLFVSLLFSMVFGMADPRHLAYAYPFLLFGGIYSIHHFYQRNAKVGWGLMIIGSLVGIATGIYTLLYYVKW